MNIKFKIKALELLTKIGNDFNIKIGLEDGTLLGAIRENRFIAHDLDIDIGMEYELWNKNLLNAFKKNGFRVRRIGFFRDDGILKFVGRNKEGAISKVKLVYKKISICFNVWHTGVDEYKDMVYYKAPSPKHCINVPKNLLFPKITYKFYDMDVWIPENYIQNIEFMYGESWRTPIKNYYDTPIHVENYKRFRNYYQT